MALYMKQDFAPPVLSRKWIAIKFRPNMLLQCRHNIISILESGLLFREDSIEVEQEAPSSEQVWSAAGGGFGGWMTRGEGVLTGLSLAAAVCLFPPRSFSRSALINVSGYASIPVVIRAALRGVSRGSLAALLRVMRHYLALARRAAACLKEFAALHTQLGSLSTVIESLHTMLCRQQSELARLMSRSSSALLGNAPWLRDDVSWGAVVDPTDSLMKIHHAFLVVQSTLLKHIAMAHFIPALNVQKLYKNHNERLYWIHNTLIRHLLEEFQACYEPLQRMYRLLKNSGVKDTSEGKKFGAAVRDGWVYSEIHTGIARACLELKLALNKSNGLDMFLDSCATNDQEMDLDVLNRDVDDLIDNITKCLTTVQNSQIRLQKLKGKFTESAPNEIDEVVESAAILKIEDAEPQTKDEVFYFVKTEDDSPIQPPDDVSTAPGQREKENTKIVLNELKRKLGKREDVMRERERQALVKTMPELKNIPEFPRQIKYDEFLVKKGYITKLKQNNDKKKLFRRYKIDKNRNKLKKFLSKTEEYINEPDIKGDLYEANSLFNLKSILFTITSMNKNIFINRWRKIYPKKVELDSSGMSEGLSDVEAATANKNINQAINNHEITFKFTKKDLEISESSSESDFEFYNHQKVLLNDIRRHRVARKKNYPNRRPIDNTGNSKAMDNVDESLKPIEYSFGTGLAMASVLQVNNPRFMNMEREEVFIGDGEVSNDSGNDEDA